jgi:hypothetical protein
MSAPELAEAPAPPPPTPPAPPPGPPPAPLSPDMQAHDLLNQAFTRAGEIGEVVLAGQIGGALSRLTAMINEKAAMQAHLDAANKKWLQLDQRAQTQDAEIEGCRAREQSDAALMKLAGARIDALEAELATFKPTPAELPAEPTEDATSPG